MISKKVSKMHNTNLMSSLWIKHKIIIWMDFIIKFIKFAIMVYMLFLVFFSVIFFSNPFEQNYLPQSNKFFLLFFCSQLCKYLVKYCNSMFSRFESQFSNSLLIFDCRHFIRANKIIDSRDHLMWILNARRKENVTASHCLFTYAKGTPG